MAATDTWVGNSTANWADANWAASGNNPPVTGDSLVFGVAGSPGLTLTDNLMTPSTYTLAGITFSSGASAFVINSGTSGVNGFTLAGGITNSSTTLETINDGITLNSVETFTTTTGGGNLTIGGNGISGAGGVAIGGAGTLILSGANTYTGTTTAAIGTTSITGSLGSSGTPAGAIAAGSTTATPATLDLSGPSIFATSLTLTCGTGSGSGNYDLNFTGGSTTISGVFAVDPGNNDGFGLASLSGGTMSVGSVTISRDHNSFGGTLQTGGNTSDGLYVHGTALNVTGAVTIGSTTNSSANMNVASGSATVGGLTTISSNASARYSLLSITGGIYNANGGVQIGGNSDTGALDAELLITSGTLSTTGITFAGNTGAGGGTQELLANGGTIYIGTGGIVSTLGGTTVFGNTTIAASGTWSSTVNMTLTAGDTPIFQAANASLTPQSITLGGVLSSGGGLNLTGGGSLTLTGANTYSGATTITSGTLALSGAGSLGSGTYAGNIADGGTFSYGSSATQTLSGVLSGAGALIQNGPGTLTLSGPDTINGPVSINAGTLAIGGAGSLDGGSFTGNLADAGTLSHGSSAAQIFSGVISGVGGVTQAGLGVLTLSGPDIYTGPTAITTGTLALAATGSLANTAITASSGGTLLAQPGSGNIQIGSTGASLTLNTGSTFSMVDGSIGTVTLNSVGAGVGTVLTLAGGGLSFEIGSAGADELIANNGGVAFTGGGTDSITLTGLGGAPGSLTQIPLLSVPGGVLILGDFSLSAPTVSLGGTIYDASLSLGGPGGNTELLVSLSAAGSANYYFTGAQGASWSTVGNFATDHSGLTAQSALPSNTSNVFLAADTASSHAANYETETLDGNYTINSLSFTGTDSSVGQTPAATNPITVQNGTGTALTIAAASSFVDANGKNYSQGTGLVVQAGSAAHTISANINLGNSQTWEVDGSPLTVSGVIADGTTLDSLAKTGTGTLILTTNTETYDGGTTVSGGTVMLGLGGLLAPAGALVVTGTGTFDVGGNSQTVGGLSDGGASTGVITSSVGNGVLTIVNSAQSTYGGAMTDNNAGNGASLALVLQGSSNVTLSGSSSFTGGTTLSSGNLTVSANYSLGSATSANANAGLALNPGTGATVNAFFTSANPTIASLNTIGVPVGTSNVILGNTSTGSATTLSVGGGGVAQSAVDTFAGTISDRSGTVAAAIGNLTVFGGGFLILASADTFTGVTNIVGSGPIGPSSLELSSPLALEDSTLNYNDPTGIIIFTASGSFTIAGLTGATTLTLEGGNPPTSGDPVSLTIGNNNVSSTYNGDLVGVGALVKAGSGTFTLAGGPSTYTGTTTVSAGTLTVTGGLGASATPVGAITVNAGTMDVNGGSVYTPSFSEDSGPNSGNGPGSTVNVGQNGSGGSITVTGNLGVDANNGDQNGPFVLDSGTVTANSVTIGRGNNNQGGTPGILGTTGDGIYVNGGTLNVTTTLGIGTASGAENSSANMRMDSGSVTVGGITTITNTAGSRFSVLAINGGVFTDNDTSGTGIQVGGNADTAGPLDAELLLTNGTLNTPAITLGVAAQTSGIDEFLAAGGTTYIGSGGIVSINPAGVAVTVALGDSAVGSSPIIGASAPWSSSLPITLSNSSGGAAVNFQTANASGTPENISLGGALSGGGGLIVSGSGTLTLTGVSGYTGSTTINNGASLQLGNGATGNDGTIATSSGILDNGNLIYNRFGALSSGVPISGAGNVIVSGSGSQTLTAVNTYNGATTINPSATLQLGDGTSGDDGTIIDSSGILDNGTLIFNRFGTLSTPVSINGAGVLEKIGAGTQTLTANNGYTGATTVAGGMLVLSGSLSGTASVSVTNGATLELGVSNAILNTARVTLANGTLQDLAGLTQKLSDLAVEAGNSTLTLGATGSVLNFADSSADIWTGTLAITDWNGFSAGGGSDEVFIGSTADLSAAQLADITFVNGTLDGSSFSDLTAVQLANGEIVAAVPEPGTWAMLLAGVAVLGIWRRARRVDRITDRAPLSKED